MAVDHPMLIAVNSAIIGGLLVAVLLWSLERRRPGLGRRAAVMFVPAWVATSAWSLLATMGGNPWLLGAFAGALAGVIALALHRRLIGESNTT